MAVDHTGKKFETTTKMCNYYGIGVSTYYNRIDYGWSKKDALTTPVKLREQIPQDKRRDRYKAQLCPARISDPYGKMFSSYKEMAAEYGVNINTLYAKRSKGIPLDEILDVQFVEDHFGNKYKSVKAMCRAYGVPECTYYDRIKRGLSVEAALSTQRKMKLKKGDKK